MPGLDFLIQQSRKQAEDLEVVDRKLTSVDIRRERNLREQRSGFVTEAAKSVTNDEYHAALLKMITDLSDRVNYIDARENARQFEHVSHKGEYDVLMATTLASMRDALRGDIVLALEAASVNLAADDLNAAEAESVKVTVIATLKTAGGLVHSWYDGFPHGTTASKGTVADGDVVAPAIEGTPVWYKGRLTATFVIDTDGGVTKTYVASEQMTVDVAMPSDLLVSYSVPAVTFDIDIV